MVEGPVSKRRFSRRQVRQAIIIAAVVIAVLVVGSVGWYFYSASRQSGIESSQQEREQQARADADQIAAFFNDIKSRFSAYVGEERVRTLFETADPEQLVEEADAALSQFPFALKLRLLPPGVDEPDNSSQPPLTYGSLDILRKAERTSGAIAAEVLLFGTDNQHIVLVDRVKNTSDQLIGIAHLSLNVDLIEQALAGFSSTADYLEIRQSGRTLGSTGDSARKEGDPVTVSIAGTLWTLVWWGGSDSLSGTAVGTGSITTVIAVIVAALLLLAGGAFVILQRGKKWAGAREPVQKPQVRYQGAIRAIMDGAHPGMEKLIANMPEQEKGAVRHVPGISTGMTGDDVTVIMKKNDGQPARENPQAAVPPPSAEAKPVTASKNPPAEAPTSAASPPSLPEVIFRKYDIRGVVGKTLTPDIVRLIGQAIGSAADKSLKKKVVVGRDGRVSSPELAESLIKGLRAAGRDVIDIGVVPTPVLYFATHHLKTGTGVMVTGSHNGPEYNGLKVVIAGDTLSEDGIRDLYNRIVNDELVTGEGSLDTAEIIPEYVNRITEDIPVALGRSYKLVVDAGNGVAGLVAPRLYSALGHDVIEMYCDLDGRFPNHHPDPGEPKNMQHLIERVREENADLGFAFDGDGDRLGIVDAKGNIIWPDRQLMVFARDVLSRNPGAPIIYDVKCTNHLRKAIEAAGGKAVMWKTGHSLIKSKMKALEAPLAGEMSGHIFFKERWYGFDDALYSGARMLEILLGSKAKPTEFFAAIPESVSTPELKIDMPESEHAAFMQKFEGKLAAFKGAEIINVDGFRVELPDGWGLIRPSNTTPCLVVRFEADSAEALAKIQNAFRQLLLSIKPDLKIPF